MSRQDVMTTDLTFTGAARRIRMDGSAALHVNRTIFQTGIANQQTMLGVMPNGTNTAANLNLYASSDPDNAVLGQVTIGPASMNLVANKLGTASYPPMIFFVGGAERMRIATDGSITIPGGLTVGGTLNVTGAFGLGSGTANGHMVISMATGGIAATAGSEGQLELQNASSGASKIAFHRTGAYAAYFGLDTDNLWCVGGWSMGAARYPLAFTNMSQTLDNKTMSTLTVSDYMTTLTGTYDLGAASTYTNKVKTIKAWSGPVTMYCSGSSGFVFGTSIYASGALVIASGDSMTFFSTQGYWWVA